MRPFDPGILQLIRRFILIIGFSFLVIFTYKASRDVSSQKLANGQPYVKKPISASMVKQPMFSVSAGVSADTLLSYSTQRSNNTQTFGHQDIPPENVYSVPKKTLTKEPYQAMQPLLKDSRKQKSPASQ